MADPPNPDILDLGHGVRVRADGVLSKLDLQFASDEAAGSSLRATVGTCCLIAAWGIPSIFLCINMPSFGFIALCCLGWMPLLLCLGLKDCLGRGGLLLQSYQCFSCSCGACLCCTFVVAVALHAMIPGLEEEYRICCQECHDYCSSMSFTAEQHSVCPDLLPNETLGCDVLPPLQSTSCDSYTVGGNGRYPSCTSISPGCVTPVWCLRNCGGTWAENEALQAPDGSNADFVADPCYQARIFRDADWAGTFAVVYILVIGGIICTCMSFWDSRRLVSMGGPWLVEYVPPPPPASVFSAPQPVATTLRDPKSSAPAARQGPVLAVAAGPAAGAVPRSRRSPIIPPKVKAIFFGKPTVYGKPTVAPPAPAGTVPDSVVEGNDLDNNVVEGNDRCEDEPRRQTSQASVSSSSYAKRNKGQVIGLALGCIGGLVVAISAGVLLTFSMGNFTMNIR